MVAACSACSNSGPIQSPDQVSGPETASGAIDLHSNKIVDAANTFIGSLEPAKRQAVVFNFTDSEQRVRWSNLPEGIFKRAGLMWGDLNGGQQAALMNLLSSILSPEGVKMIKEQMDADDELNKPGSGGAPPPGVLPPGIHPMFGSDYYYVAFLGTPSTGEPWMLQFGGHHLAINATIVGPHVTITPSLTGGQPVKYTKDGKPIYIVEKEVMQATRMLSGLTAQQRSKAIISTQRIDLILGPGHDNQTLQPEGLSAGEMTQDQKDQLLALIEARLSILNANDFAAAISDVRRNLDQTWFAWYGQMDAGSAYFRVTGPTIVLEFSPQDLGGDASNHLHNMYRNPVNDYGAAWASIR